MRPSAISASLLSLKTLSMMPSLSLFVAFLGVQTVACFTTSFVSTLRTSPAIGKQNVLCAGGLRVCPNSHRQMRVFGLRMQVGAGSKNAEVVLGQYTDLPIKVVKEAIPEAEIQKVIKLRKRDYRLDAARFTDGEGGARMGHTVLVNFIGYDVVTSQELKGTKAVMHELELREGQKEPWATFVQKIAVGMGQDEMKSFSVQFPADYPAPTLANKQVRFECIVKAIMNRAPQAPDTRPEEEIRAEVLQELSGRYERINLERADAAVRLTIMRTCTADTTRATEAVSWAKFGERSTLDLQWQIIKETIGKKEGIADISAVEAFLRNRNTIQWADA